MKFHLAALAALSLGTAMAQAPDGPPAGGPPPGMHHESPQQHLEHLATLLDLSADQKTQVGAILEEEHASMKAAFEQNQASGTRPTFEQMRAEHEQRNQEMVTRLTPILTADQMKKFKVLMAEHGPPGGPH